jgi:hypothetical protein
MSKTDPEEQRFLTQRAFGALHLLSELCERCFGF